MAGEDTGRDGPASRPSRVPAHPSVPLVGVASGVLSKALSVTRYPAFRGLEQATTSQGPARKLGPL